MYRFEIHGAVRGERPQENNLCVYGRYKTESAGKG